MTKNNTYSVEPPVIDEQALGVRNTYDVVRPSGGDEPRRVIARVLRDRVRQPSRGVHVTKQHVRDRIACLLSWDARPDYGGDIRMFDPRFNDSGSDGVDDDDGVRVRVGYGCDEVVGVDPKGEVVPVAFVAVDGDVAFSRIRVDEHDLENRSEGKANRRKRFKSRSRFVSPQE